MLNSVQLSAAECGCRLTRLIGAERNSVTVEHVGQRRMFLVNADYSMWQTKILIYERLKFCVVVVCICNMQYAQVALQREWSSFFAFFGRTKIISMLNSSLCSAFYSLLLPSAAFHYLPAY